jgi:hypothetical protein
VSAILLAQLYAMRSQLDATILAVEASRQLAPVADPSMTAAQRACSHPEDKQADASVMGGGPKRLECTLCGWERDA